MQLGEVANPPRLWAQLVAVRLQTRPTATAGEANARRGRTADAALPHPARLPPALLPLYHLHAALSGAHFLLFFATRVAGLLYIQRVVWPHARSLSTVCSAVGLAVFSLGTIATYALSTDGVDLATVPAPRKLRQQ